MSRAERVAERAAGEMEQGGEVSGRERGGYQLGGNLEGERRWQEWHHFLPK